MPINPHTFGRIARPYIETVSAIEESIKVMKECQVKILKILAEEHGLDEAKILETFKPGETNERAEDNR